MNVSREVSSRLMRDKKGNSACDDDVAIDAIDAKHRNFGAAKGKNGFGCEEVLAFFKHDLRSPEYLDNCFQLNS